MDAEAHLKRNVGHVRALQMGVVARFPVERRGRAVGGIAVWTTAGPRAWLDVCAHRGNTVDGVTSAGLLECSAHGAIYDPASGLCVDGPCPGQSLVALGCGVDGEQVWVDDAEPEEPYDDSEP